MAMAQYFASGNGNIKYYRTFANRKYTDKFMKQIILITGGARSGKSSYAERLALSLSPNPVYLATSRIWDEEFRQRVLRHQANRGPEWTNIEEEKELSRHSLQGRVVLIDCVTLWCTNYFFDLEADTDKALAAIKAEFDRLTEQEATFIFVTNNIEEALYLADRIVLLTNYPAQVKEIYDINLPRPRDTVSPEFLRLRKIISDNTDLAL